MAFEGLPDEVDFMAAVAAAAPDGVLTPIWVFDPYEAAPFAHAVASFEDRAVDDAEEERTEWRVRLPDGYAVDWNAAETRKLLYRAGDDMGAEPELSLTRAGHAGKRVLFRFDDGHVLSLPLLPVND